MSSTIEQAAASVTPAVQEDNIWVLAGTASSQWVTIPEAWRNQYLTIEADGDSFYVAFGAASMVVDETATTAVASNAIGAFDGDECIKIADGAVREYDMRKAGSGVVAFAWKGSGTSGYLRIERSSGYAS